MPLIYNTRTEPVTVLAGGNYFEFKPDQVKLIHNPNIARFIETERRHEGLVSVPDICGEDRACAESQSILIEARKAGISARIEHLEYIKTNLLVSLAKDLEKQNSKVDPLKLATPSEKKALKELALYEQMKANVEEQEYLELQALVGKSNGSIDKSDAKPASDGSKTASKSAVGNK